MTTEPHRRDQFITLNGLRFHYRDWGAPEDPVLLLLHGAWTNAGVWDEVAAALCDRHRVLALSQRGWGETEWAQDYGIEQQVADLTALVQTLGLTRLTLIGHSMGAAHAWHFAAAHAGVVERLVIEDMVPPLPRAPEPLPWPREFADLDTLLAFRRQFYPALPEEQLRRATARDYEQRADGRWAFRCDPRFLDAWPPDWGQDEEGNWAALRALTCPTLLVMGAAGGFRLSAQRERAERMVREIRDCRLVVIPDVGHNVHVEQPADFLAAVQAFLGTAAR